MKKITSPDYQIPEVIPFQCVRGMRGGANRPILVHAIDLLNQTSGAFVLKYRGAERMDETASRRELLASWMATELEIWTPEPVLVQVDSSFAAKVPLEFRIIISERALGLNFGSRFIDGKSTVQPDETWAAGMHQMAARIFAFDLLIQNSDRRLEKPNMFWADNKIYVIDHELSFGFLSMLPTFANPEPWILNETDVLAARKHIFYPILHRTKNIDWDAALSTLTNLTPLFWQRAVELLPETWKNAVEINRIKNHVESIQYNTQTFITEICNKLIG